MGKISTGAQDQLFPQRVAEDFDLTDHTRFHSVTGKSSLAWEGRPSSGKRWSIPSGHIPMGTESSLAKKSAV